MSGEGNRRRRRLARVLRVNFMVIGVVVAAAAGCASPVHALGDALEAAAPRGPVSPAGTVLPKQAMSVTSAPSQHMTDPTTWGFGTKTTESRQVTLLEVIDNATVEEPPGGAGGIAPVYKPGTVVPPDAGMRWIAFKLTVTSTTQCSGFGETRDFCLILPGTIQTVNAQDVNLLAAYVLKGCPSVYQTPRGDGDLEIGQSVTYCSAVEVPKGAKVTAITYEDGVAKPLRWSVSTTKRLPPHAGACDDAQEKAWPGKTVPPVCDNNGAFRRVYSSPGQYAARATVTLPAANLTLLPGQHPTDGDTGFVYLEGWPGPGTTNFEAGFQYSPLHNWYTFYTHPDSVLQSGQGHEFPAGDTVAISIVPYSGSAAGEPKGCARTSLCLVATVSDAKYKQERAFNVRRTADAFIYARMTTIAQKPRNYFGDGAAFGPVKWFSAQLAAVKDGKVTWAPWNGGGAQDWPRDGSRVVVLNADGKAGETDLIDLYP